MKLSSDQQEAVERLTTWFTKVRRPVEFCTGGDRDGTGGDTDAFGDDTGDDDMGARCPATPHTHVLGIQGDAPVISLGGLAGTGKTSVMRHLGEAFDAMKVRVLYGTPTHKAAGVLRGKLDERAARLVSTFYSLIYIPDPKRKCTTSGRIVKEIPTECTCGNEPEECECPRIFEPCGHHDMTACTVKEHLDWIRREFMKGHTEILIVDESSMLSQDQVDDLRRFGIPVVLVGDHGQLPPVNAPMNRWTAKPDIVLTENHRQKNDTSGIVDLALWARQGIQLRKGIWGDGRTVVLGKDDPRVGALLNVDRYRARSADASTWPQVICATNALRSGINRLFHGTGGVRAGDRVIALRMCKVPVIERITASGTPVVAMHTVKVVDPATGAVTEQDGPVERTVHNGWTGTVVRAGEPRGGHLSMIVELDGTGGEMVQVDRCAEKQFGAEKPVGEHERARDARLWDYAYAITAHKAQGSEWDEVIVLDDSWTDKDRWRYTAATRARSKLVVVSMKD